MRRSHFVADLPRRHRHAGRDEARGGIEACDGAGHAEEDVSHRLAFLVRTALEPQDSRVVGFEVQRVKIFCVICKIKIMLLRMDWQNKKRNASVTLVVGHRDRIIVDEGHLKMTVSGQQPPVSNHPAVQALGIAEYYLKRPVDGVNLREEVFWLIQTRREHSCGPTSLFSIW